MDTESLEIVRRLPIFAELTEDQLECLRRGEIVEYAPNEVIASTGAPPDYFFVSIEGEISHHKIYGNQEVLMAVSRPGTYMGEIFILLDIPWLSTARSDSRVRMFRLKRDDFWRMLSVCHSITRDVMRTAATRLRNIEGFSHQREKLVSLGTMAAGLAHELNNPAAAARRASEQLKECVERIEELVCNLSKKFTPENWRKLLNAEEFAAKANDGSARLSSVARSDYEEQLLTWLDEQKIEDSWKLAPTFAATGLKLEWFQELLENLPPETHYDALAWLEAQLTLTALLGEVQQSTGRISELVKAVKSYSYMDKSPVQDIDIHEGLQSTLTILKHKLKGAVIETQFAQRLPRVQGYGSELNQVWTNLIDNAIDAVSGRGRILISTNSDSSHVTVEIADSGPGIPPDVQKRMFEPFFTTKGVGSGTGLGLVMSHRIVADRHGGEIEFDSEPGQTRFRVRLPIQARVSSHRADEPSERHFTGLR